MYNWRERLLLITRPQIIMFVHPYYFFTSLDKPELQSTNQNPPISKTEPVAVLATFCFFRSFYTTEEKEAQLHFTSSLISHQ